MRYEVHTVAEGELPKGMDRLIVERVDGPPLLLISGAPARCWAFMRRWEDASEPPTMPTVLRVAG